MKIAYPAIFTQTNDKKDTYLVYIPDLDGATEGYGLANAIQMARDYIGCALYNKEQYDYPDPRRLKDVNPKDSEFYGEGESIVSLVDIDIEEYCKKLDNAPVRRNVSLPSWLNKKANEAHINVSRVLQEALMDKLA